MQIFVLFAQTGGSVVAAYSSFDKAREAYVGLCATHEVEPAEMRQINSSFWKADDVRFVKDVSIECLSVDPDLEDILI